MSKQPDLSLDYLVRPPKSVSQTPPLLIMLHGYGSNEQDLFSFAHELPDEFLIISARAPLSLGFGSYAWYTINFEANSENFSNLEEANAALDQIDTFLEEIINEYHPDPNKVFLMGFSQGTILSMAYALNHPEKLQYVLALSGYVNQKLIKEPIVKDHNKNLDFFVSHGSSDQVIPVEWARQTPDFLKASGVSFIFKEYPVGHGVAPQNFYDLLAWIKARL